MFDWNDEELTNIIWDEAGETDDRIVPYQEGSENHQSKKEWSQETATIKSNEQNKPGNKVDLHGRKLEDSSNFNANEGISTSGFGMDLWPELSVSNAEKTDQDSMASEVSNNLVEETKCSSKNGKEQGDFVDYSWANIGSFDDFDRIFSNDDPIFGDVSLAGADELWSSSKEVTNSPRKSFPTTVDSASLGLGAVRSTSEHLEVKREYEQQDNQSVTFSYGKLDGSTSHGLHNVEFHGDKSKSIIEKQTNAETGGKTSASKSHLVAEKVITPNELADKAYRQKKLLKFRKKPDHIGEAKLVQDLYGTWTPSQNPLVQYENNLATSVVKSSPLSVVSHQRQLRGPDSLRYQNISNSFVASSTYGNPTNQYPAIPVLPNIQSGEFNQQLLLSCYDIYPGKANPGNRLAQAAAKPLRMTPQEKIEKLRRRQQMQALFAIKKQQQQFTHQVPCTSHSVIQKSTQENQFQHVEDIEDLSTLATFDPNSPLEQDDSNTVAVAIDDYSVEDTVLYQLQDIIAKLDVRIRLCIRDSLFRLAQSAMQRNYAGDTSSTNKSSRDENEVAKEENKNHNRMSDTETETNPIDRAVAHLLFHQPSELSGKHPETPESPASTKFPCARRTVGLMRLPMGSMSHNSQQVVKQNCTHQVSKDPSSLLDPQNVEQFKNSPFIDTPENASNYGPPADSGVAEVEASQ